MGFPPNDIKGKPEEVSTIGGIAACKLNWEPQRFSFSESSPVLSFLVRLFPPVAQIL